MNAVYLLLAAVITPCETSDNPLEQSVLLAPQEVINQDTFLVDPCDPCFQIKPPCVLLDPCDIELPCPEEIFIDPCNQPCPCEPCDPETCPCSCHDLLPDKDVGFLVGVSPESFYHQPSAAFMNYQPPSLANYSTPYRIPGGFIGGFGGGGGGSYRPPTTPTTPLPPVPEPTSLLLWILGAAIGYCWRKKCLITA